MILLNFSHPLTERQTVQIELLIGRLAAIHTVTAQFDHTQPFAPQIVRLADETGLTADEWQTEPLLVNLPGYAPAAGCLLAEIHGRSGHFPALLRVSPVAGSVPTSYEVSEVIDIQQIREDARGRRAQR